MVSGDRTLNRQSLCVPLCTAPAIKNRSMLRRSLVIIVAFILLAFGLTAGYALLNLRGADEVLKDARSLAEHGNNIDAVRLLDLCENSVNIKNKPALRQQVWQLRMECNSRLQNFTRALADNEQLLAEKPTEKHLQIYRVYLLAALGQGKLAKQRALEFVTENPTFPRGLELAGEACQVDYRDRLIKASEQLQTDLEYELLGPARDALLSYLYRPAGDQSVTTALLDLRAIYELVPARQQVWVRMHNVLKDLRDRIQQALEFYEHALEIACPDKASHKEFFISAYRGAAFALQQSGRNDCVVAESDIYRGSFQNVFTVEAAIDAVKAHLEDGLFRAAISVANSFLPSDAYKERLAKKQITADSLSPLFEAKVLALYRLDDRPALLECALELARMQKDGLSMPRALHLAFAYYFLKEPERSKDCAAHFDVVFNLFINLPAPVNGPDMLEILMPLHIQVMQKTSLPTEQILSAVNAWANQRPASILPLRERAMVFLNAGQSSSAMNVATELVRKQPRDEESMQILAAAAKSTYADSGQDGEGLLAHCLSRNVLRPEVPHPICLLLCGEAALAQNQLSIARECSRIAEDEFPLARWPRHLRAKALMQGAGYAEAADFLDRWITKEPTDSEAIRLWFACCQKEGLPIERHLQDVVRVGLKDAAVTTAMLRRAILSRSTAANQLAKNTWQNSDKASLDPEHLALAAQVWTASDPAIAKQLIDCAAKALPSNNSLTARSAIVSASLQWLLAVAAKSSDKELTALVSDLQKQPQFDPKAFRAMLTAAEKLAAMARPEAAYALTTAAILMPGAQAQRDGAAHLLAGQLALKIGDLARAREFLTAAVSFDEGSDAAEPLARLLLAVEAPELARAAYALAKTHEDPALARLFAPLQEQSKLTLTRLTAERGDLAAQLVAALISQPPAEPVKPAPPLPVEDGSKMPSVKAVVVLPSEAVAKADFAVELLAAAPEQQQLAVQLAAILREPALAKTALHLAQALHQNLPGSIAAQLLLARALCNAEQPDAAAQLHLAAFLHGDQSSVLFAEVVQCVAIPGYQIADALLKELQKRAQTAPKSLPEKALVWATRYLATKEMVAGNIEAATTKLARLWIEYPLESNATIFDAVTLADHGRLANALQLLALLRTRGSPTLQKSASDSYFALAAERGTTSPEQEQELIQAAKQQLAGGGPFGPPLRFMMAKADRMAGLLPADLQKWITVVLNTAAAGDESVPFALNALVYLDSHNGRVAAKALVDEVIAAHPEVPEFWVVRARYLAQDRHSKEGLADARSALSFGATPELELELLATAIEGRSVEPSDSARIAGLPQAFRESPLGNYVRGLLALRNGKPAEALPLLAKADTRFNGFNLFAAGLAQVADPEPKAQASAGALFAKFAADYPSSSLARSARSFARQLGVN